MKVAIVFFIMLITTHNVIAKEKIDKRGVSLTEVISAFTKNTSKKVITSADIHGRVQLIGQKLDSLDYPELLTILNLKGYTATQPTMGYESGRGREVLYFVSDRPGGKGGMDIWYAILSDRANKFVAVGNAGSKINTAADELTPFYHLPDSSLYFS